MINYNNNNCVKYNPQYVKNISCNRATVKETHRRRKKLTKENKDFLKYIGLLK